jgi:hypothetical protein
MAWLAQAWQLLKTLNPLKLARAHVESELEKVELKQTIVELRRDKLASLHEKQVLEQRVQELESAPASMPVVTTPPRAGTISFYSKSARRVVLEKEAELSRRAHFQ